MVSAVAGKEYCRRKVTVKPLTKDEPEAKKEMEAKTNPPDLKQETQDRATSQ